MRILPARVRSGTQRSDRNHDLRSRAARRRLHRNGARERVHDGTRSRLAARRQTGVYGSLAAAWVGWRSGADACGIPGARIVHRGRLRPIPPDFRLFAPTSLPALLRSGIFTPAGLLRAAMEPFVPRRADDGDESLASFVTRRFGREVLDRLAQPLIGGIYSGDPARLSMEAALPQFLESNESTAASCARCRPARVTALRRA